MGAGEAWTRRYWTSRYRNEKTFVAHVSESVTRTTFVCAFCEQHIDGDEVKRRTKDGWFPYHPLCAPDENAVTKIGVTIRSHCGRGNGW